MEFNLQRLVRCLSIYAGRDKLLRALYAALVFYSTKQKDPERAKIWLAYAKQLSAARLVFRQCNHPSMIIASRDAMSEAPVATDKVNYTLSTAVTAIYTVYGAVEAAAWLADAKIIIADSVKLFRWCLYLWLAALICGMIRLVRVISGKPWQKSASDRISLLGLVCDFVSGANSLPAGILWSGKLSVRQASSLSFIASAIGFWKLY
uniref:Peroxisomal biogenesis factor 11 n=1 Tax=Panagrellus redivivus TaxID=6233 RepID=A0A7E4UU03_PANRE